MFRFLYADRRMRRQAIDTGNQIQLEAEQWAFPGLLFVVFVLPFLANPSLLLQPPAWLWWVRGWAVFAAVVCLGVYAVAHLWHVPAQLAGATVDAMQQAGPDGDKPIAFPEQQIEPVCALLSQQLAPQLAATERRVLARERQLTRQMWARLPEARTLKYPYRRAIPLPTLLQEPSA
jgi:hypothetical protein